MSDIRNNRGIAANLNSVIRKLMKKKNAFFMRIDADDINEPDRLVAQLRFLKENPTIDVVSSWATQIDKDGNETGYKNAYSGRVRPSCISRNPIIHPSVLARSNFFLDYGLYDESFKYSQDWELWARACSLGAKFYVLPKYLLRFRFSNHSINRRKKSQHYVVKLAYRHLLNNRLKLAVLVRSIVVIYSPTFILDKVITISNRSKK